MPFEKATLPAIGRENKKIWFMKAIIILVAVIIIGGGLYGYRQYHVNRIGPILWVSRHSE